MMPQLGEMYLREFLLGLCCVQWLNDNDYRILKFQQEFEIKK